MSQPSSPGESRAEALDNPSRRLQLAAAQTSFAQAFDDGARKHVALASHLHILNVKQGLMHRDHNYFNRGHTFKLEEITPCDELRSYLRVLSFS
jgi:hypothetical protein